MYKQIVKRIFDLFIALIVLIILSPLLIPVIIVLMVTGEHYVWYFQDRIGFKNQKFKIWKFATMLKASPNLGTGSITTQNDPRVFPFGRFLRKTKINELPQVMNILNGTMALVGPRPQMEVDYLNFPPDIQKKIYDVKPGITGIGSIVFRDEEKWFSQAEDVHEFNRQYIAPYKGSLEIWYQNHLTLHTDIMLIFLTAWAVISPQNELVYKVFKNLPERPKELK
jgi:lipopolysaccharide/colanic/teichoic acid biosynthesis glycosyltransferase